MSLNWLNNLSLSLKFYIEKLNKARGIVNHINDTNAVKVGMKGVGYTEVSHPYNFDYSCSPEKDEVTNFESTKPKVVDLDLCDKSNPMKDTMSAVRGGEDVGAKDCVDERTSKGESCSQSNNSNFDSGYSFAGFQNLQTSLNSSCLNFASKYVSSTFSRSNNGFHQNLIMI